MARDRLTGGKIYGGEDLTTGFSGWQG